MTNQEKSIHLQIWTVSIILSLLASLVVGAMTWQSLKAGVADAYDAEKKNSVTRNQVEVNTTIIKKLGDTVQETNARLEKFTDNYYKNREEDQKVFREILMAVKK